MSDRPLYETMAVQHEGELEEFIKLVRGEQISSYLEIGAKFGGTLWRIAQIMQPKSRIVAIDLPHGTVAWPESGPSLKACIDRLTEMGHEAIVIWGDSTDADVMETVRALGPYDLVFIDANHTMPYVRKDWENYGPMARMVAFHDISWRREFYKGIPIDVPELWARLRYLYRSAEFKLDPKAKDNGIGVLWRE